MLDDQLSAARVADERPRAWIVHSIGQIPHQHNLETQLCHLPDSEGAVEDTDVCVNAHQSDVQDMLTRISLAQVVYSQGHNGQYGNTAELIAAGLIPKDLEGIESTGYRFQVVRPVDGKSWYATAEPAEYGRTGLLSFYLDASGVRSGDAGGKPLVVKN